MALKWTLYLLRPGQRGRSSIGESRLFRWFRKPIGVTWGEYSRTWLESGKVLGGNVGPRLEPSREHKLCERFSRIYPDAREFLLEQIKGENPLIAAYAFKCLIRIADITSNDLPSGALDRCDEIDVQQSGCCGHRITLGQFFSEYFDDGNENDED